MKHAKIIVLISILAIFLSCSENPTSNENFVIEKENVQNKVLSLEKNANSKSKLTLPSYPHNTDSSLSDGEIGIKAWQCGYKYVNGWAIVSYKQKPGKYLGIATRNNQPISWQNYYNKYGFSAVLVNNTSEYSLAKNIGFKDQDLMVNIPNYSSAYNQINSIDEVGFYHVNEPIELETYSPSTLSSVASMIHELNPNAKMMMCSYKWPTWWFEFPFATYGDMYKPVLNNASNAYIMCDEYPGNYFGTPAEYWGKFSNYYGYSKHIAAWMHINKNNYYSNTGRSFPDLFSKANSLNINRLWLWATKGDETDPTVNGVESFCNSAFYSGWLRGFAQNYRMIWRCQYPEPCDCTLDDPEGWYLEEIIWIPGTFEVYP